MMTTMQDNNNDTTVKLHTLSLPLDQISQKLTKRYPLKLFNYTKVYVHIMEKYTYNCKLLLVAIGFCSVF